MGFLAPKPPKPKPPPPPPPVEEFIPEPEDVDERDVSEIDRIRRRTRQPSLLDLITGDAGGPTIL